jgi:adenylosuccinate lyase
MKRVADELQALSPLDGRYAAEAGPLRPYFSEFAYLRDRVRAELGYLAALSDETGLVRPLTSAERDLLNGIASEFSPAEAGRIREIERDTRHDVKAIENYLRQRLARTSLADSLEWLHFGLTSEDVNSIAGAIALRDSRDQVILPALGNVLERVADLIGAHRSTPMLGRTHGQPAVPTTFGKEMAVYYARLQRQVARLSGHRFAAKLTGAVGNFNALAAAAPGVDWLAFSEKFVGGLGLQPELTTTQTLPYENWLEYFEVLRLTNSILIDFAQDMWRYAGDGYLEIRAAAGEAGSSTMPQKVNPIDFENAEGNLGLANALFQHYAAKLPVSRLQRDLSDSTVRRTFGSALGHSLVAYASLRRGLERIEVNAGALRADLESHWEVVAEGAQTILRAAGVAEPYELLKALTRGRQMTKESYRAWVEGLEVDESVRARLLALTPLSYIGLAEKIAANAVGSARTVRRKGRA